MGVSVSSGALQSRDLLQSYSGIWSVWSVGGRTRWTLESSGAPSHLEAILGPGECDGCEQPGAEGAQRLKNFRVKRLSLSGRPQAARSDSVS